MARTKRTVLALLAVLLSPVVANADVFTYEIYFEGGGLGRFDWDTDNELISNLTWDFGSGLTGGANLSWTVPIREGTLAQWFFEIVTGEDVHPTRCVGPRVGCGHAASPEGGVFGYPNRGIQFNVASDVRTFYFWDSNHGDISGSYSARPVGPATFEDVLANHWAYSSVEALVRNGITAGCGSDNYCPNGRVTRAQLAVFLERAINGGDFSPQPANGTVFNDVSAGDFAATFIEQLYADGITSGCGNNNYCPNDPVTRAQMAVFLLRAKYGARYTPPGLDCVDVFPFICSTFGDVAEDHWARLWIEQLSWEGITAGCGNGNYCPDAVVTRDQMAVFLVRTFGL